MLIFNQLDLFFVEVNIYVVFLNGKLFSAFTVKHEMLTILRKHRNNVIEIFRIRDGTDTEPVKLLYGCTEKDSEMWLNNK